MKTTKKIILTGMACCFCVNGLFAGGLLTNTNQSVHFLRNPARGASTEIDAVYTNPAGLANLSEEGWHFSVNNQSAFQTRTITSTFAPFVGFGGNETKSFEGKTNAPFIPSVFGVYKKEKWAFSGSVSVVGGGGSLTFDKGLPSFESQVAAPVASLYEGAGIQPPAYTLDSRLKGTSMIFGIQLGATYKINDNFSAFLGGRVSIVRNEYEGYLRNVQIPAKDHLIPFYTVAAQQLGALASGLQGFNAESPLNALPAASFGVYQSVLGDAANVLTVGQAQEILGKKATDASNAVPGINQLSALDMQIKNCKQSGFGVAPILGFDFKYDNLNVGVKYEFKTSIDVKNDSKTINTTGESSFDPDVKTPYDIPAIFTIGAQYDVIPNVTVSAGYVHYFDSDAKMGGDKQKYTSGVNDYLFGAEWRINKMFLISAGGQITKSGLQDDYQSDLDFFLGSYSIGFGGAVNVSEKVRINLGYLFTKYDNLTKEAKDNNYNGTGMPGKDLLNRTNKAFGIGVDFRF